jgi:hypothetical protein
MGEKDALAPSEDKVGIVESVGEDGLSSSLLVMPDFEAVESWRVGEWSFGVFPDVATQFALQDGFEKGADFILFAGREKFHAAVAQIPDGAGHVEPFCYVPDCITETDSLDVALVKNLNG